MRWKFLSPALANASVRALMGPLPSPLMFCLFPFRVMVAAHETCPREPAEWSSS